MKGDVLHVWADYAMTRFEGQVVVWLADGQDYATELGRYRNETEARWALRAHMGYEPPAASGGPSGPRP